MLCTVVTRVSLSIVTYLKGFICLPLLLYGKQGTRGKRRLRLTVAW